MVRFAGRDAYFYCCERQKFPSLPLERVATSSTWLSAWPVPASETPARPLKSWGFRWRWPTIWAHFANAGVTGVSRRVRREAW